MKAKIIAIGEQDVFYGDKNLIGQVGTFGEVMDGYMRDGNFIFDNDVYLSTQDRRFRAGQEIYFAQILAVPLLLTSRTLSFDNVLKPGDRIILQDGYEIKVGSMAGKTINNSVSDKENVVAVVRYEEK